MGARSRAYRNMHTKSLGRIEAILVMIGMLFLGTVFSVGMQYWNKPVERAEAIPMTAVYASYDVARSRHSIRFIQLSFQGNEISPDIDGNCATEELINLLDAIPAGTEVSILLHPNSDTVLEIATEDRIILNFEESQRNLTREATAFQYIGWFLYAGAIVTGIKLIRGWKKGYIRI